MPEVVGTAYVRIRMITTDVAAQIKDAVDRGAVSAEPTAEKAGGRLGDKMGVGANKAVVSAMDNPELKTAMAKTGDKLGDTVATHVKVSTTKGILAGRNEIDDATRQALIPRSGFFSQLVTHGENMAKSIRSGLSRLERFLPGDAQRASNTYSQTLVQHLQSDITKGIDRLFSTGGPFDKGIKALKGIKFTGIGMLATIATPAVLGALKTASYYLIGLTAEVGNLLVGLSGVGVAGVGAFAAIGTSALPVLLALKDATPQLQAFKDAIGIGKKGAVGGGLLGEIATMTQKTLLPGLAEAVNLTKPLIHNYAIFGGQVGKIVADWAKFTATQLTSNENMFAFKSGLASATEVLKGFLIGANRGITVLPALMNTMMDVAAEMGADFANLMDAFNVKVTAAVKDGRLRNFFQDAYNKGRQALRGLTDLVIGLWNALRIGGDQAQPAMDRFADFAKRWRDYTNTPEGKNKIAAFFGNALTVMHEVNLLFKEILDMLLKPLKTGNTDNIVGTLQMLRETVLPAIANLIQSITSNIQGDTLQRFLVSLTDLMDQLSSSGIVATSLDVMTGSLNLLTAVIQTPGLGPAMVDLLGFLWGLATIAKIPGVGPGLKLIGEGLGAIVKWAILSGPATAAIGALGSVLTNLWIGIEAGAVGGGATASLVGTVQGIGGAIGALAAPIALASAAGLAFWGTMYFVFPSVRKVVDDLWDDIVKLKDQLAGLFSGDGDLKSKALDAAKSIGMLSIKTLSFPFTAAAAGLTDIAMAIGHKLGPMFASLGRMVGNAASTLWGWVTEAAGKIGPAIAGFATTVWNGITTFVGNLPGWLATAAEAMVSWIGNAVPRIPYYIGYFIGYLIGTMVRIPIEIGAFFVTVMPKLWDWITNAVPAALGAIGGFFSMIWGAVTTFVGNLPGWIAGAASALWGWITAAGPDALGSIGNFFGNIWGAVTTFVGNLPGWIAGAAGAILSWIGNAIVQVPGKLGELATKFRDWAWGLPGQIMGWISGALLDLVDIGSSIIDGIVNGIKQFAHKIWDVILDVGKGIIDGFSKAIGKGSPAKKFIPHGESIMQGVALGITQSAHLIDDAMKAALAPSMNMDLAGKYGSFGSADLAAARASLAASSSMSPVTHLKVFIGDKEITELVRVEQDKRDDGRARVLFGRGVT